MKLKLKESIRANGVQYLPPAVIDADEIGITQADANVLVRRGTAEVVEEVSPVKAKDENDVSAGLPTAPEELPEEPKATAEAAVTETAPSKGKKR